jgi:hypothetical protein
MPGYNTNTKRETHITNIKSFCCCFRVLFYNTASLAAQEVLSYSCSGMLGLNPELAEKHLLLHLY